MAPKPLPAAFMGPGQAGQTRRAPRRPASVHTSTARIPLGRLIKNNRFVGEAIREFQAGVARNKLGTEQMRGAFPTETKQYVTKVDLRPAPNKSGAEEKVKVDGKIQYIRLGTTRGIDSYEDAMVEMIRLIMRKIPWAIKGGPGGGWKPGNTSGDRTGKAAFRRRHYEESFALMRNNRMVVGPGRNFKGRAQRYIKRFGDVMTDKDVLAVTNIQPYARRIDEGAHFKKPWTRTSPRGVFNTARKEALRSMRTKALYISQVEYGPLPGNVSDDEYTSQGSVTYAEGRNRGIGRGKKAFVYSGRIMRKHRVYPILFFGPPRTTTSYGMNQNEGRWTGRKNAYQTMENRAGAPTIASQIRRSGGIVGNLRGRL